MFHVKHDLWGDPHGPDCPRSGDPHDLAIAWETAPEADWFSAGRLRVSTRHRLHMHVRLRAVPRVATFTNQVADTHRLPLDHTDTVAPEMAHGHHDTLGSFDEHDIAGQCPPASGCSAALPERIPDRSQSPECVVIRFTVVHPHDDPVQRRQQRPTEAGEGVRGLRTPECGEFYGRGPVIGHRHKVDRVRGREGDRSVAGHPIGRTAPDDPVTPEGEVEVDPSVSVSRETSASPTTPPTAAALLRRPRVSLTAVDGVIDYTARD